MRPHRTFAYRPAVDSLESRRVLSQAGMASAMHAQALQAAEMRAGMQAEVRAERMAALREAQAARLAAEAGVSFHGGLAFRTLPRFGANFRGNGFAGGAGGARLISGIGVPATLGQRPIVTTQNTDSSQRGGIDNIPAFNPTYFDSSTFDSGLGNQTIGGTTGLDTGANAGGTTTGTGVGGTMTGTGTGMTGGTTTGGVSTGITSGLSNGYPAIDGQGSPYSIYNGLGIDSGIGFSNGVAFYNGFGFYNGLGSNNGLGFINGYGNPYVYSNEAGFLTPGGIGSTSTAVG